MHEPSRKKRLAVDVCFIFTKINLGSESNEIEKILV